MIKLYQEAERRELRAPQEGAGGAVRKPTAGLSLPITGLRGVRLVKTLSFRSRRLPRMHPSLSLPDYHSLLLIITSPHFCHSCCVSSTLEQWSRTQEMLVTG